MNASKSNTIYTFGVGIIFLGVLCGMLWVMFFVPMPASNEKPIMLVCGSLVTAAVIALGNLARGGSQLDSLISENEDLRRQMAVLAAKVEAHQNTIDRLLTRIMPDDQPALRIGRE